MHKETENKINAFAESLLMSYGQVFFSKQKVFAVILLLVTFFDWNAGISGLIAVAVSNLAAIVIGFNRNMVSQGLAGFNSLLVGLGMGISFEPSPEYYFLLVFASLFTLLLTIALQAYLLRLNLPFLSLPFLIGIWMVSLTAPGFSSLAESQRGIFVLNEIYRLGGLMMVKFYLWAINLELPPAIAGYFKSLAAIFFQYNILAGVIIAVGILVYSRIAFLLSVTGFFSAYLFFTLVGANLNELNYTYIGFNFILSAIAIGGFFIIPSQYSFLWIILLTPVISFIIASAGEVLQLLNLPIYSFAFNIVVLLFLYVLKFREKNYFAPELVVSQQLSPEDNLYFQHNYASRFDIHTTVELTLPVVGEWVVTQGHDGEHTHREQWRHAWDFEIADDEGSFFRNAGVDLINYYSYGKPVIAAADGIVQDVVDGIPDNSIGEMNIGHNWGNTIVIKHAEQLYTKVSHLKSNSIKVSRGAYVKRGDVIAQVGNSGRSLIPHLHFQVQADPFIGSRTLDYPFANYLVRTPSGHKLVSFGRPQLKQKVAGIMTHQSFHKAYNFVPGQTLSFELVTSEGSAKREDWDVKANMYNFTFLECRKTGSKAYFRNDGNLFYFTYFEGPRNNLLYYFYLGSYKLALGIYPRLVIEDAYPVNVFSKGIIRILHDFVSPFYQFLRATYRMEYLHAEDDFSSLTLRMKSAAMVTAFGKTIQTVDFNLKISEGRIDHFEITTSKTRLVAKEIPS